ncbi:MAG: family oxidoreductase [Rhodospirillales bacterium]|nr:family oxidoreductase [Rhodospirillales bacterium]
MSKRFDGKAALVTGAASGIGRATARRLGSEGASLALADINIEGAETVAKVIRAEYGVAVTAIQFDAAQPASCRDMVDKSVAALGRLDVLMNIAGIFDWNHFTDFPDEAWDQIIGVDLSSLFHISKRAMPHLVESKGNIVNASSTAGIKGQAYCAAYCAAKHGVVGLTKSLSIEYAAKGVRVNAVCPGGIATALSDKVTWVETFDIQLLSLLNSKMNGGAMAEPEEVAAIFAYLASDEGRYITGATFAIDGGQLAG